MSNIENVSGIREAIKGGILAIVACALLGFGIGAGVSAFEWAMKLLGAK